MTTRRGRRGRRRRRERASEDRRFFAHENKPKEEQRLVVDV
jgi:hypothetical protein